MSAPLTWPPNNARGWAAGARVSPNRKTAVPPNDASQSGDEGGSTSQNTKPRPAAAPAAHQTRRASALARSRSLQAWGRLSGICSRFQFWLWMHERSCLPIRDSWTVQLSRNPYHGRFTHWVGHQFDCAGKRAQIQPSRCALRRRQECARCCNALSAAKSYTGASCRRRTNFSYTVLGQSSFHVRWNTVKHHSAQAHGPLKSQEIPTDFCWVTDIENGTSSPASCKGGR